MKKICLFILSFALLFGFAALAGAQQKADKALPEGDKKFLMEAASGGLFEVEAGKVAAQKAESEDVKKFGQRMVDDHSKANNELMQLASTKGITLPKQAEKKHVDMIEKLSKKSGKGFDKEYMEMMVKDHSKDVSAFKKEAKDGKDPDLKAWANKMVPTLEEHHKMAQDLTKKK